MSVNPAVYARLDAWTPYLAGIRRVAAATGIMEMPKGSPLLRNMIYDRP